MTEQFQDNSHNLRQAERTGDDLTGRDRLVSNVIFVWAAHFVFIVAGFIMPRMIDRRLGQELLGVWDFAWSLVHYFELVQMGLSSSVNRYVARYRAVGDIAGVNRIVSSASVVLGIGGLLALGLTITISLLLPQLFGTRLGDNVLEAQWVVLFLGVSIVIEISLSAFRGVLTGCHRWELHNIIRSGWHVATIAAMILALLWGGSLSSLAVITSVGLALEYMTRVIIVYRVCKGLRLRASLVTWKTIRKLLLFGGKTLIPGTSGLLLNQTTSILIMVYLGPAALALYTRPRSLVRHINTLVSKMALTLTPTTSSLQRTGSLEEIRKLLISSVRYSLYLVLPMVLVLMVFGSVVLRLWMGPRYANGLLPAVLGLGYLAIMVQAPVLTILRGLNAHGRAGMAQLVASLCSVGLILLALGALGCGIVGVAVAVTLPLTIINLVYLPHLICRRVGLSITRYFLSVIAGPAVHVMPFVIILVGARLFFHNDPTIGLAWGAVAGGIALVIPYYRHALPDRVKMSVSRNLHKVLRTAGSFITYN